MVKIQFETGQVVEFDGDPTPADVEEIASQLKLQASSQTSNRDALIRTGEAPVLENLLTGAAKGAASTVTGLSNIGKSIAENTVGRVVNAIATNGDFSKLPESQTSVPESFTPGTEANQRLTKPIGIAQDIGFGAEKIAEFLTPTKAINIASKGAQSLIKGTSALSNLGRTAIRAGTEAIGTGAVSTVQQGSLNDQAKTNAIVAGLFSAAVPSAVKLAGNTLGKVGEKIQNIVLKPTASDLSDGFSSANISKYGVGGSPEQVLAKTSNLLNDLSAGLNQKLKSATNAINLNQIFDETVSDLTKSKAKNFGNNQSINNVVSKLKEEIVDIAGKNGLVSVPEAQLVKQGAGTKGAWVFGNSDPDATAIERVYNLYYNKLKTAIEKASPEGVKDINKKISELIPIQRAAIRRIPVEQRSSVLSLNDSIGIYGALFDPKSLAIMGANRLAKSGRFANFLIQVADKFKKPQTSEIGKRILGQ